MLIMFDKSVDIFEFINQKVPENVVCLDFQKVLS